MKYESRTVTFRNSHGTERVIFETSSLNAEDADKAAWNAMMEFLTEHNYKSYYQRVSAGRRHEIDNVKSVDVGSWSEFFYIYPVSCDVVEAHFEKGDV